MKTPQIKPSWKTGIYIGNGRIAQPQTNYDIEVDCNYCQGEGIREKLTSDGYIEFTCDRCYDSCGKIMIKNERD